MMAQSDRAPLKLLFPGVQPVSVSTLLPSFSIPLSSPPPLPLFVLSTIWQTGLCSPSAFHEILRTGEGVAF